MWNNNTVVTRNDNYVIMSSRHVMKIGAVLYDERCSSSFSRLALSIFCQFKSCFTFRRIMSRSVDRLRQLEEIEKVRGIGTHTFYKKLSPTFSSACTHVNVFISL